MKSLFNASHQLMDYPIDRQHLQELEELLGDDFESLIVNYMQDSCHRIQELAQALDAQKLEQVRYVLHTIKGASANMGALRLLEMCDHFKSKYMGTWCCEQTELQNQLDYLEQEQMAINHYLHDYLFF